MPLFEYVCESCADEFEELVRRTAQAGVQCPKCGSTKVARKLSSFSLGRPRPARESHTCAGGSCCGGSCRM